MSNDTRIYSVCRADGTEPHLVRAGNKLAALRHVVSGAYITKLASQDDLADLLPRGIAIETLDAESEDEEPALFK